MKITRTSPHDGVTRTINLDITEGQYSAWQNGTLIQKAMPNLNADQREFVMTGLTGDNWDEIFEEEEPTEVIKMFQEQQEHTAQGIAKAAIDHFLDKQTAQSPCYHRLPPHMMEDARQYVEEGTLNCDFLRSVLENNLSGAYGNADDMNIREMFNWAMWLHNDIPALCWGTPDQVKAWCVTKGLNGLRKASTKLSEVE